MATVAVVADANFALGQLREAARRMADSDTVVRIVQCTEAQASATWNGVFLSLEDIFRPGPPGSTMTLPDDLPQRLLRAARPVVACARKGYPLDMRNLFQFGATILGEPARLREEFAWLDGADAADALLILAPPGAELRVATEQFLSWVDSELDLPIVCKVALGLLQWMLLSPVPGSDHLARLWPALELIRRGVLPDHVLPFADWLRRNRTELRQRVLGVVERGELDAWIVFVANGIEAACQRQLQQIARIERIIEDLYSRFARRDRLRELISAMISGPITTNVAVAHQLQISDRYARTLIKKLQDQDILEPQNPNHTPTVYVCRPVLQVLGMAPKDRPNNDQDAFRDN